MLIYLLKNKISSIRNNLHRYKFMKEWAIRNGHNNVVPVSLFPLDIVSVGSYSYGELNLITYDPNNKSDVLKIGNFVSISTGVRFLMHEMHQLEAFSTFPLKSVLLKKPNACDMKSKGSIIVEDEVWIGNQAIVLSGVTLGKGSIIAAGAVVTKNVPPYAIVGGVPAKVLRYRFPENIITKLNKLSLIELSEKVIKDNIDLFYQKINIEVLSKIEKLFGKKDI